MKLSILIIYRKTKYFTQLPVSIIFSQNYKLRPHYIIAVTFYLQQNLEIKQN